VNGTVIGETVRRHVTSIPYVAYVVLLAIIGTGVSTFDRPGAVWPSFVALLAIIVGCGPIGPEFSSGTLQLILVKPVTRATYLLSRVAGVVLVVWLATIVPAFFELAGRLFWGEGAVPWLAILAALVSSGADTILTVSLLVLLGSITRAYFNVAIYIVTMIGLSMTIAILGVVRASNNAIGRFLNEHIAIERAISVIERNLFPDLPARLDPEWLLMVLSNAAIALVLACFAFRRREVPYGAD
jgi:ABC-type transport system involved in multi-copper enzyme maturation permease subunit